MLATLIAAFTPTALGARWDMDLDVETDVDMTVAARADARGEGRYTYAWDWGDGEASAGVDASARHAYRAPGVYRVVVIVTDEAGNEHRRAREVTVKAPPTDLEVETEGAEVEARADVGSRVRVTWDWGDGSVSVGRRASHRYDSSGTYEVVAKFERGAACWTQTRTVVIVAHDHQEEEDQEEERGHRHREAGARVSIAGGSARVGVAWDGGAREETARASQSWSHDSSVTTSSYDRHDVPGAPAPVILALVGLVAVGARRLFRR